jgi:transposase
LFEFVPLWGITVFFCYVMRRVDCRWCGVKVEAVPWAEGKQTLTRAYMQFLANWARRISWKEVAEVFHTSWEKVFRSVEWIVEWGWAHRDLSGITAIGVDELLWRKGHRYVTVVYQIDAHAKRLLWVGEDRTLATLYRFFRDFGDDNAKQLKFVCSDMWKPYLHVNGEHLIMWRKIAGRVSLLGVRLRHLAIIAALPQSESSHSSNATSFFHRGGFVGLAEPSTFSRALRLASMLARA